MRKKAVSTMAVGSAGALVLASLFAAAAGYGERVDSLPNWQERAVIVLTNECRMAPSYYRDSIMRVTGILQPANYPAVNPVFWHLGLNRSARDHTVDMAYNCGMVHNSCDGTAWDARIKSYYTVSGMIAENLAYGQTTPQQVVYTWLWDNGAADKAGRDGHRQNIMGAAYRDIGTGFVSRGSYWTEDFGGGSSVTHPRRKVAGACHLFRSAGRTAFLLNYYDAAAKAPRSVRVLIDGARSNLSLESGAASRGTYAVSVPAVSRCRTYWFEVIDGDGVLQRHPADGKYMTWGEGGCSLDYISPRVTPPPAPLLTSPSGSTCIIR
jgi:hypothetical protein